MHALTFVNDVNANGGATVSIYGASLPTDGYYVSDEGGAIVSADIFNPADVQAFITRHESALLQSGAYLGAWLSDGKVYLDVTRHFDTLSDAMRHGADNHQLAIWDITNSAELAVPVAA